MADIKSRQYNKHPININFCTRVMEFLNNYFTSYHIIADRLAVTSCIRSQVIEPMLGAYMQLMT